MLYKGRAFCIRMSLDYVSVPIQANSNIRLLPKQIKLQKQISYHSPYSLLQYNIVL